MILQGRIRELDLDRQTGYISLGESPNERMKFDWSTIAGYDKTFLSAMATGRRVTLDLDQDWKVTQLNLLNFGFDPSQSEPG